MIYTGETYHNREHFAQVQVRIEQARKNGGMAPVDEIQQKKHKHDDDALEPVVNHGRWLIECPTCNSAELAFDRGEGFMCTNCWNDGTGEFIPVKWPDQRKDIEGVLNRRPGMKNRNWDPRRGDTLEDELAENLMRGLA